MNDVELSATCTVPTYQTSGRKICNRPLTDGDLTVTKHQSVYVFRSFCCFFARSAQSRLHSESAVLDNPLSTASRLTCYTGLPATSTGVCQNLL